MALRGRRLEVKTPDQIALMREAGLVVGETLALVSEAVAPGVTTGDLDALAERHIRDQGAVPSFKGYHGFPGSLCVSVNDEVVHGIPGDRALVEGDVVSIDCGAIVQGWHGDAAVSVGVGAISEPAQRLLDACEEALWAGLAAMRIGGRIGDVSHAVETAVRRRGSYGVLEDYVGHGIGSSMHLPPDVPNVGAPGKGHKLAAGIALAIEPMITEGTLDTEVLADDWTVVTDDGSLAAHFEHTVTATADGVWVLTALDGGRARLESLGVPYGGD